MKLRKLMTSSLFVCGMTFFFAFAARAAEEGSANSSAPTEWFKWVNFAIVAAALIWVFGKKFPPWFRGNAEKVSSAITTATAAAAEADRKLRDAEQLLARLQEEVRELRAQAEDDAAAGAERLRALAE